MLFIERNGVVMQVKQFLPPDVIPKGVGLISKEEGQYGIDTPQGRVILEKGDFIAKESDKSGGAFHVYKQQQFFEMVGAIQFWDRPEIIAQISNRCNKSISVFYDDDGLAQLGLMSQEGKVVANSGDFILFDPKGNPSVSKLVEK